MISVRSKIYMEGGGGSACSNCCFECSYQNCIQESLKLHGNQNHFCDENNIPYLFKINETWSITKRCFEKSQVLAKLGHCPFSIHYNSCFLHYLYVCRHATLLVTSGFTVIRIKSWIFPHELVNIWSRDAVLVYTVPLNSWDSTGYTHTA